MRFLASGKVKDLYEVDTDKILFRFTDRVSAFDVKFREEIPRKGEVLCKFAEYWFEEIFAPNHFLERRSENEIVVKRMSMLPIECVVRGYFYGSLVRRWEMGKVQVPWDTQPKIAEKLPYPLFDPTTKSEHDVPVDRHTAVEMSLVTEEEFDWLEKKSIEIYSEMAKRVLNTGFILADLKLEFGKIGDEIILGDSIGPDECRLWLRSNYEVGRIQEAYDKQILRDWLTSKGYQRRFDEDRASGREPVPPAIPNDIIQKMTARYITAYEKITKRPLGS